MNLAPYATNKLTSKGRITPETHLDERSPYQHDRDRIIHSKAFRRLMHKSQVFLDPKADHVRTRLTHSIEVAQIARSLARALLIDEDLAETVSLAHDLGHPPFGHAGEDALQKCALDHGGFDHNEHGLAIITELEHKYPRFKGLNLTWETLEGCAKHNGPVLKPGLKLQKLDKQFSLALHLHAGPEAQVAAVSDDIAYDHHDLDDGIRGKLFNLNECAEAVPLVYDVVKEVDKEFINLDEAIRCSETIRRLISMSCNAVISASRNKLSSHENVQSIYEAGETTIVDGLCNDRKLLKQFLSENFYASKLIKDQRQQVNSVISKLYNYFLDHLDKIPEQAANISPEQQVVSYIAGMTDRFALATATDISK